MRKVWIGIVVGSLLLCGVVCLWIVSFRNWKIEVQFDSCVDGDTAWFIIGGKREKVRFLGIDTPETVHPNGVVEEYGEEASFYTCDLLRNAQDIYLEYDQGSDSRDKYGRVLGWVFVDGENLSVLLVEKGYAQVKYVYGDYRYIDLLCTVQEKAYMDRLGIWSQQYDTYEENYCVQ